jgi:hypothetical protein
MKSTRLYKYIANAADEPLILCTFKSFEVPLDVKALYVPSSSEKYGIMAGAGRLPKSRKTEGNMRHFTRTGCVSSRV